MNIAVRLPNWLGDTVMAVPALLAVRAAWPGARVLAAGPWAALLSEQGLADVLADYPRTWRGRLRAADTVRCLRPRAGHPAAQLARGRAGRVVLGRPPTRRLRGRRPLGAPDRRRAHGPGAPAPDRRVPGPHGALRGAGHDAPAGAVAAAVRLRGARRGARAARAGGRAGARGGAAPGRPPRRGLRPGQAVAARACGGVLPTRRRQGRRRRPARRTERRRGGGERHHGGAGGEPGRA